ncbi:hypothetical protein HRbin29_00968 [bacterium HR29]|nr:hypothetical protein HRbin29_00968 [bacterium HR29]
MSDAFEASGAALARAQQALYRFGALAGAAGVQEGDLGAAGELLRARILPLHPDPLVRHAWQQALAARPSGLALDRTRFDAPLFLERTLLRGRTDPTGALYELCLRAGFRPSGTPDDLAVELELAAELCALEADAHERGDGASLERALELRRELLEDHLVPWLPALREALEEAFPEAALLIGALAATCRFDWHRLCAALADATRREE